MGEFQMRRLIVDWVTAFGETAQIQQACYTVMIKSVRLDALDCSNLAQAKMELLRQNPRLQGKIEILTMGMGKASSG